MAKNKDIDLTLGERIAFYRNLKRKNIEAKFDLISVFCDYNDDHFIKKAKLRKKDIFRRVWKFDINRVYGSDKMNIK